MEFLVYGGPEPTSQ